MPSMAKKPTTIKTGDKYQRRTVEVQETSQDMHIMNGLLRLLRKMIMTTIKVKKDKEES